MPNAMSSDRCGAGEERISMHDTDVLVMGGISFRTASIGVREKIAFTEETLPVVLRELAAHPAVSEVLLLSTCNRTEFYLVGRRDVDWSALLSRFIAAHSRASREEVAGCLYLHTGTAAAHHLFRVAAGLDSMVTGECEIVQQLKRAAQAARTAGTAGTLLQRLLEKALAASKRARTQVRYDICGLSVASIAASACMRSFPALADVSVLIIGAGDTAELTLHYLVNKGVRKVKIANRTRTRAQRLAHLTHGEAIALADIPRHLASVNLIICCTSSPTPVLTREMLTAAQADGQRKLIIDLAVPRDVEPEVGELPGVRLLNVDNLHGTAAEIAGLRQQKIRDAEAIVTSEADDFGQWLASRRTVAILQALRQRIERLQTQTTGRLAQELELTAEEAELIVAPHTHALVTGILREALAAMQQVTGDRDDSPSLTLARHFLAQCDTDRGTGVSPVERHGQDGHVVGYTVEESYR